eukprot:CAMPEP_0206228886 /NCGR_PEP_ID=MMETSP0047_2-20121206/9404_1 /ASSEMBLY_ACC=CAM_ASM_000192 /TAXON_ID=195065 /ORGANISM="Chroomonas mesostigmatica_cf, Strain CCMP1168" /LENGTH=1100 /DNA_ID=CAMNT_0053652151 /DNA_START=70 /DNA_END=3372 /DNA_ORIENTATION=+
MAASGAQYNYVVTAHKPSNVNLSATGNFTSPTELNLIVAKCNRLVIYTLTPDGLQPVLDTPIYGRIATLELFRTTGAEKDSLCLTTERWKFCVLEYDADTRELTTKAMGDLQDRIGKPVDSGQVAHIDPNKKMVGLHLYDGLFKVIPIDSKGLLKEAFNIRLEELQVIDLQFLYVEKEKNPTILVLYQDPKEMRHLKTYEINIADKDLQPGPWQQQGVELGATTIIPVPLPLGGALLIGEQTITHLNGDKSDTKTIPMGPTVIRAWGKIDDDGSRFLLGSHFGKLYVLVLEHDGSKVLGLKLEVLGQTSCATTISYLDSGVVFVGSSFGDSQLIKLHADKDDNGSYLEVLETFTNLGPIQDFCVVDLERQGQGQVVTCSGTLKDGSLRVVRNGIGINEQAQVELPGIKGLWNLRDSYESEFDKFLVQSFIGETRVLEIADEELGETEMDGFEHAAQTIWCGNVKGDCLVQVTEKSVRLVSASMKSLVQEWSPGGTDRVTLAAGNVEQVVVATGSRALVYLEVKDGKIVEVARTTCSQEISCLNVHPLGVGREREPSAMVAVGMWDMSVHTMRIPSLESLSFENLGGEVIPRSLLFATLEGVDYLLCALGDGHLFSFNIDSNTGALWDRKKVSLGTQPMTLSRFTSKGCTHVFAASDRPTVIYSNNKKLLFSNVNLKEVTQMSPFNSEDFADSLAISTESGLTIGTIDDIQKLHIRTVPLGEQPRRIVHQEMARAFCVCTIKVTFDEAGEDVDEHFVKLIDDQTFEVLSALKLKDWENACSMSTCQFSDDTTQYLVVGTAIALPHESEPTEGRVLVFEVAERKLRLVAEKEVKGAAYTLKAFNGKLLVGVNSKIELLRLAESETGGKELTTECVHRGHILVLYLESRGDFILVGDLMRSMSLLTYKSVDGQMEELAHDFNANWMTSISILDDDTYIGAENHFNLFTLRKNTDATTDEDRARLEVVGEFHLGDLVNRFRQGSLVMRAGEAESSTIPTLIFGTVNGVIGIIASLPKEDYDLMLKVQGALNQVIKGVGGLRHEDWRSFQNERVTTGRPSKGFLDGDLIESFLDLRRDKMEEVARAVGVSADELSKRVEELQRLH